MPLINCPDCGREVSDTAPACPQCARPMRAAPPPLVSTTAAPVAPGPAVVVQTQSKSTRFVFGCLAVVLVVVLLAFLVPFIAAIILPSFAKSRQASQQAACIANLKMMDGAKSTWALDKSKSNQDSPTDADLFGPGAYVREKPSCPAGGVYSLNTVEGKPTCTIDGHTF